LVELHGGLPQRCTATCTPEDTFRILVVGCFIPFHAAALLQLCEFSPLEADWLELNISDILDCALFLIVWYRWADSAFAKTWEYDIMCSSGCQCADYDV
jgi:hypothetical protein